MPKNSCIMQIWTESGKSALPICNYSQILYQFLTFTQNLKRSLLEKKLINTFNYVELSTSNYSTFSNEYASLIQSIGAELDSFFKLYCSFNFNDRKTISHYANVILQNEPAIIDIELNVLSKQLSIKPFESWSISLPAKSLSWWQSYDNIKHSRTENFIDSSLKNALYILGALYILESKYLVKIVDVSCEPDIPDEESHQSSKLHAKHFYVSRLNCVPKTYPFAHKKIPTKPINTGFVGIYLFIQTRQLLINFV